MVVKYKSLKREDTAANNNFVTIIVCKQTASVASNKFQKIVSLVNLGEKADKLPSFSEQRKEFT